ncbi:MAG: exodeoxyribonuclease V subunit alpha [Rhodocyclaceae bacterium]
MNDFEPRRASDDAAQALAEGLSAELLRLARARGAPPESLAAIERAVPAIVAAAANGGTCARIDDLGCDPTAEQRAALFASTLVSDESGAGRLPLVLDAGGRLYLARYFDYERRLALALCGLARSRAQEIGTSRAALERMFARNAAAPAPGECDWQKVAAAVALRGRLTIVSGGPGTGKTTTLAALLACILERDPGARIALAAPTGKAAARMLSALNGAAEALPAGVRARLPRESHTVHRLLGARPDGAGFRHDAGHPLAFDVVALDEASMIDLALAVRLVEALFPGARLILLGDKDQLASVEAGSVFAALCANPALSAQCRVALAEATGMPAGAIVPPCGSPDEPLADTTVWLTRNYRFGAGSPIGRLAAALRSGSPGALDILEAGAPGLRMETPRAGPLSAAAIGRLLEGWSEFIARLREPHPDPAGLARAFERHRVLAAVREGTRGAETVAEAAARRLRHLLGCEPAGASPWFRGRPVLIERNDASLGLYNGDVGICLEDGRGSCEVWFPSASGGMRALPAARLPPHETALAMTVHRAQGSEFDSVALLLPESDSPVLSRELLYTAVTRARSEVSVLASRDSIGRAITRSARRSGGLSARLADAWAVR